jgi:hypothetical protein
MNKGEKMEETYQISKSFIEKIKEFLECVSNSREDNQDDAASILQGFSYRAANLLGDLNEEFVRWENE